MPSLRVEYPKLLALVLCFAAAYLLFLGGAFDTLHELLDVWGYASIFLGGVLLTVGFTAPFGLFLLVETAPHVNPFLGALVGGFGALLVDLCIFEAARFSLREEIHRLVTNGWFRSAIRLLYHERVSDRLRNYLIWSLAGFIIASPLPDEIGVTMLSGIPSINLRNLTIVCFILDTLGVLVILLSTDYVVL
jgi:hypothetical protein